MSESTPDAAPSEDQPQEGEAAPEPKTFDADYVDKLRKESAKYRTEAKANADAAKRLAQIEESQKSEAEKAADRIKQLETEADEARRDALRFKVASQEDIDAETAELILTGSDEETMRKQAKAFNQAAEKRKKQGNHVPREGATTPAGESEERAFARDFFATGR